MKNEEKAIKEIISRFGSTIDLKKTPHVIIEIIRQFGPTLGIGKSAACAPPGGPPKRGSEVILVEDLMIEIRALAGQIKSLNRTVNKLAAK